MRHVFHYRHFKGTARLAVPAGNAVGGVTSLRLIVAKDFWGDIFFVEDSHIEIPVNAGDVDFLRARQAVSAIEAVAAADCLIVGGTSLAVYPAAGLLQYFRGNKLILINKSETPYDGQADLVIHDSIGKVLSGVI